MNERDCALEKAMAGRTIVCQCANYIVTGDKKQISNSVSTSLLKVKDRLFAAADGGILCHDEIGITSTPLSGPATSVRFKLVGLRRFLIRL
jgi:hypothetical protein